MKLKRFIESNGKTAFHFVENDLCIRKDKASGRIVSIDIDSGSTISGRLSGLGFFVEADAVDWENDRCECAGATEDLQSCAS